MADPGSRREGGAKQKGGGAILFILVNCPKNCMKMKIRIGPGEGARPWRPTLDPPMRVPHENTWN